MVSRQVQNDSGRRMPMGVSRDLPSAEARARQLRARIEAERRRAAARQHDDGG
jgi:hypothetical protein